MADTFKDERIPSMQKWEFSPKGQHVELGIAEMNLFINLSALGLSHATFGERLIPIGTLYDPFISRGLDALNYACYQDARFMVVATPSGVTLAPEGGAHQSIATPLIGMSQDGLCAFEPAFVDELAVMMRWSFAYLQKDGEGDPDERTWLRDETGGSVYLRLSTLQLEQPQRAMTPELESDIIDGAYWLRKPGPNASVVIAYTGPSRRRRSRRSGCSARTGAMSACSRSPRPTGSMPAGRRPRGRASAATTAPPAMSSGCSAISHAIAASFRCWTGIRRRWPGSAACMATSRRRSASSISARPAPSRISTAISASTRTRSSMPRRRRRRAGRCAI